jgi:phage protein D
MVATATPTTRRLVTNVYIKLDGTDLPPAQDVMADLLRVRVDGSVHLPDMAVLEFDNSDFKWSEQDKFKMGQDLKIYFGDADLRSDEPVFAGEVTAMELDVGLSGAIMMRMRGYDRAHLLHRGRINKVFLQVKDSDIAEQIAGELGLQTDVEPTPGVHKYVHQHNQTNWEFLQSRAARYGFELQVWDKTLSFKPPPRSQPAPVDLAWHEHLISFRATMTTGDQVNKVEVRGWDPVNKKEVVGVASSPEHLPVLDEGETNGGSVAQTAHHRETKVVIVDHPVYDQEEAQQLAQTILNERAGGFITAQGVAEGDPHLKLGGEVNLKNVGKQFTGKYRITQISHRYEPEGYKIDFEVTGRRSTDLVSLISQRGAD